MRAIGGQSPRIHPAGAGISNRHGPAGRAISGRRDERRARNARSTAAHQFIEISSRFNLPNSML
jgi:hypothetical protein